MMDKALKEYGSGKFKVNVVAKRCLKAIAIKFLGGLLSRQQLAGPMDAKNVSKAIKGWIPQTRGVVVLMRC